MIITVYQIILSYYKSVVNYYSIKTRKTTRNKKRRQGILKKLLIKDFKYKRNKILHFFLDKIDIVFIIN